MEFIMGWLYVQAGSQNLSAVNPLTPIFTSWKQPFPGIEHVVQFPMSPLTLRQLHRVSVHGLLIPLMIFMSLKGAWQKWRYAQSSWQFFLKSDERKILLKVWHTEHQQSLVGQTANYPPGMFPAVFQPQKTWRGWGALPPSNPACKRGDTPLLINPRLVN